MGQLEKYGLYVLCLLIFLIAGVSIWGGSEQPVLPQSQPPLKVPASVDPANLKPVANIGAGSGAARLPADELDAFWNPETPPSPKKDPEPRSQPANAPAGNATPGPANPVAVANNEPPKVARTEVAPPATKATYKVKAGDTFDSIARTQLGDVRRVRDIQRLNPSVKPEKMAVGTVLELPAAKAVDADANKAPAAAVVATADGARLYAIRKGDTFERVARLELGSTKRVNEIKQLNPSVDPTKLQLGHQIKLPAK